MDAVSGSVQPLNDHVQQACSVQPFPFSPPSPPASAEEGVPPAVAGPADTAAANKPEDGQASSSFSSATSESDRTAGHPTESGRTAPTEEHSVKNAAAEAGVPGGPRSAAAAEAGVPGGDDIFNDEFFE